MDRLNPFGTHQIKEETQVAIRQAFTNSRRIPYSSIPFLYLKSIYLTHAPPTKLPIKEAKRLTPTNPLTTGGGIWLVVKA